MKPIETLMDGITSLLLNAVVLVAVLYFICAATR